MSEYPAEYVWFNGKFVPYPEATVHVGTDLCLRGANVFEGLRAYYDERQDQMYIFRLREHLDRLWKSMKIMRMACPYSQEELAQACTHLISKNQFREPVHIRPVVYFGEGPLFAYKPGEIFVGAFILTLPRASVLGTPRSIACCVSSWRRLADDVMPPRVKAGANYQQSRLVTVQAKIDGYDGPIMLNERGKVSEGPGSCLMIVRDGAVITPPITAGILESITRDTLIQLFAERLQVPVIEREIDKTELYIADEAFHCGSGHEIMPITSVDRYPLGDGKAGPITKQIQDLYFDIVRGRIPEYAHWLTSVY